MNERNRTGSISESAIIHHLIRCDFNVSIPFHDVQYDLVAERDGRIARIQVKTARHRENSDSIYCTLNSASRPSGTVYSEDAFDILAMYHPKTDKCYYAIWQNIGSSKFQVTTKSREQLPRNSHRANFAENYTIEEVFSRYE